MGKYIYNNIMYACVAVALLMLPICPANAQDAMTAQDSVKQMRQLRDNVKKTQGLIDKLKAKIQEADKDSAKVVDSEAYRTAQLLRQQIDSLREGGRRCTRRCRGCPPEL